MDTQQATRRLEEVIHSRLATNAEVVNNALEFIPRNRKAEVNKTGWRVSPSGDVNMLFTETPVEGPKGQLALPEVVAVPVHDHALSQVTSITGLNKQMLDKLLEKRQPWALDLVAHNLNETWRHIDGAPAFLARSDPRGQETIKAVVSSSYKTIDVRPTLNDFLLACEEYGVQPYKGRAGEINFALKMILPRIFTVGNDPFAIGLEMRNTDWGGAAVSIGVFFERLVCLNGMTSEKIFRQTHRGSAREKDIDWSEETMRLDRAASLSAMKDTVRQFFEPTRLESLVAQLQAAGSIYLTAEALEAKINKRLNKDTTKRVIDLFRSADNVRMPEGPTWLRAAQAVSAAAQDTEKLLLEEGKRPDETVLLMERLAGDLMVEGSKKAA